MQREQRIYFRDMFRDARAAALADAEGFQQVLFAVERLGSFLYGRQGSLGTYERRILAFLAENDAIADVQSITGRHGHTATLYRLVREARNSALHQGAFARQLTFNCVELAIAIEHALCHSMSTVGDYAVHHPVCAATWHPVSFVRQTMLANSFSYLPIDVGEATAPTWKLVSDLALASYLRKPGSPTTKTRLQKTLGELVTAAEIELLEPLVCPPDADVFHALTQCRGLPIIVVTPDTAGLVGLATPFDLV